MTAKKQTRRSVNVDHELLGRLRAHCDARGISMSGYAEELLAEKFVEAGIAEPDELIAAREHNRVAEERLLTEEEQEIADAEKSGEALAKDPPTLLML